MAPPKSRKIVIMGFRSVGKSSITIQFVEGQFVDSYDPTIENTFTTNLKHNNQEYVLELVDTAGQSDHDEYLEKLTLYEHVIVWRNVEKTRLTLYEHCKDEYSIFPQSYSVGIHGYVLVYAVTSAKSFEVVKVIHEKLLDMSGQNYVPMVLVGNKTDLHLERVVTYKTGKSLADSWKAAFFESSAKENSSVQEIFQTLIREIENHDQDGNVVKKEDCNIL